jgi:hypothetical protein
LADARKTRVCHAKNQIDGPSGHQAPAAPKGKSRTSPKTSPAPPDASDEIKGAPAGHIEERATSRKSRRNILAWGLGALLVMVTVAVGVLVWRSVNLSGEVSELSAELAAELAATTTTVDPCRGNEVVYHLNRTSFLAQRRALVAKDSGVRGTLAKTHARAIRNDIAALAVVLNSFPDSPPEVQEAQDDYFDVLMRLYAAAGKVWWNDSRANVDAYNVAWSEEYRLFQVWLREIERAQ